MKSPNRSPVRKEIARAYLGGKCVSCGATENLHFDHIDRTTKVLGICEAAQQMPEVRFWEEVKKCQLLCADCHVIKSVEAGDFPGRPRIPAPTFDQLKETLARAHARA